MFKAINTKASWKAPILVGHEAVSELTFWYDEIDCLNESSTDNAIDCMYTVYSDASSHGYGGFVVEKEGCELVGS